MRKFPYILPFWQERILPQVQQDTAGAIQRKMTDWSDIAFCPECYSAVKTDDPESTVDEHNESLHDGEDVAGYGPEFINEQVDEADDKQEAVREVANLVMN